MPATSKPKQLLFLSRSAPYGSQRPQLCLELALAAAVFDQSIQYVFMDDGVYQLVAGQQADVIQNKTLGLALETLDLYGIETVLVDSEALSMRGLSADDMLLPAQPVTKADIASMIQDSERVVTL